MGKQKFEIMKRILIALALLITFYASMSAQQRIIKEWYLADTLVFKSVEIGDTMKMYKADNLHSVTVQNDSIREVYLMQNDTLKLFSRCVTKIELAVIHDNRCNGIKLDGTRCTRTVDNSKGIYYCWQHD